MMPVGKPLLVTAGAGVVDVASPPRTAATMNAIAHAAPIESAAIHNQRGELGGRERGISVSGSTARV